MNYFRVPSLKSDSAEQIEMSAVNFGSTFLTNSKSVVTTLPDYVSLQPINTRSVDATSIFKPLPTSATATIPMIPQMELKEKTLFSPYTAFVSPNLRTHINSGQGLASFRPMPERVY